MTGPRTTPPVPAADHAAVILQALRGSIYEVASAEAALAALEQERDGYKARYDSYEPGTMKGQVRAIWELAEHYGHPPVSSAHPVGFLQKHIEALEQELADARAAFGVADRSLRTAVERMGEAEAERNKVIRRVASIADQQRVRAEAAEAERDKVLANMQDEVVQSILVREQLAAAEAEVARLREAQLRRDLPVALAVATTHIEFIVRKGDAYTEAQRSRVADVALAAITEVLEELMRHYSARAAVAGEEPVAGSGQDWQSEGGRTTPGHSVAGEDTT